MSRKITIDIKGTLIVRADEGVDIDDIVSSLSVLSDLTTADVEDFTITDHEVVDSR